MVHPAIIELMRLMPPPGTVWPRERQLVFIQALDAVIANVYGGKTHMIWIGDDGEIHIAARESAAPDAVPPSAGSAATAAPDAAPPPQNGNES
jgi:hypothetical protein